MLMKSIMSNKNICAALKYDSLKDGSLIINFIIRVLFQQFKY